MLGNVSYISSLNWALAFSIHGIIAPIADLPQITDTSTPSNARTSSHASRGTPDVIFERPREQELNLPEQHTWVLSFSSLLNSFHTLFRNSSLIR